MLVIHDDGADNNLTIKRMAPFNQTAGAPKMEAIFKVIDGFRELFLKPGHQVVVRAPHLNLDERFVFLEYTMDLDIRFVSVDVFEAAGE